MQRSEGHKGECTCLQLLTLSGGPWAMQCLPHMEPFRKKANYLPILMLLDPRFSAVFWGLSLLHKKDNLFLMRDRTQRWGWHQNYLHEVPGIWKSLERCTQEKVGDGGEVERWGSFLDPVPEAPQVCPLQTLWWWANLFMWATLCFLLHEIRTRVSDWPASWGSLNINCEN